MKAPNHDSFNLRSIASLRAYSIRVVVVRTHTLNYSTTFTEGEKEGGAVGKELGKNRRQFHPS